MDAFGISVTPGHLIFLALGIILGGAIVDFVWCAVKTPKMIAIRLIVYGGIIAVFGWFINVLAGMLLTIAFGLVLSGILLLKKKEKGTKK